MWRNLTLEQLRMIVEVADTGSFRAAAARHERAQSAVSQLVAACEAQIGIRVFDRSAYRPVPTAAGRQIVDHARVIIANVASFAEHAALLARGFEPVLAIAVDPLFPPQALARAAAFLQSVHREVSISISTMTLGGPFDQVESGAAHVGISVAPELTADGIRRLPIGWVPLVAVAAPAIGSQGAADAMQIVLSDRTDRTRDTDFGVGTRRTWRVTDLSLKRQLILDGCGWGGLPAWMIQADLAAGTLVRIEPPSYGVAGMTLLECACLVRTDAPPGPLASRLMALFQSDASLWKLLDSSIHETSARQRIDGDD